jgi:hypothetical protein
LELEAVGVGCFVSAVGRKAVAFVEEGCREDEEAADWEAVP